MLRALLAAALFVANPALAQNERHFPTDPDGTISFNLPSGNLGCTYVPAGGTPVYRTATGGAELHCTRMEPSYRVVVMDGQRGGHGAFAPGEVPGLPHAGVLPYGAFWQAGPFTCLSARAGLICTNGTGAGLRMARGEIVTW